MSKKIINNQGHIEYRNEEGDLHREDGPAYIVTVPHWREHWYINGQLHREDGPAYSDYTGSRHWLQNGQRHREDGPAVVDIDGRQVWWLIGVKVTEELVNDLKVLTAEKIQCQENTELRAWLIDRLGWANYIRQINAQPIDSRHNHVENSKEALYQIENQKQLVVTCPTGRVFSLHVPDKVKTCEEAQRWLGNDNENRFNVIGRT